MSFEESVEELLTIYRVLSPPRFDVVVHSIRNRRSGFTEDAK